MGTHLMEIVVALWAVKMGSAFNSGLEKSEWITQYWNGMFSIFRPNFHGKSKIWGYHANFNLFKK